MMNRKIAVIISTLTFAMCIDADILNSNKATESGNDTDNLFNSASYNNTPISENSANNDSTAIAISPEKMFEIQLPACRANEKLFSSFGWNETYIYPDDFAGTFINYDTLHVLLTDENSIGEYKKILEDFDCISFDIVKNSYNDLYSFAETLSIPLTSDFDYICYYVDVKNNSAVIGIEDCYYDDAIKLIPEDDRLSVIKINHSINEISVIGGTNIHSSISSSNFFTLGGSGTYYGEFDTGTGFLTCGHGNQLDAAIKSGNTTIGTVDYLSYGYNVYGDYSISLASAGYTATPSVLTTGGNYINYSGYLLNPPVGTYLYKYGCVSGQAYCEVTQTGMTLTEYDNDSTIIIKGISQGHVITGTTEGGDSGGPYRFGDYFCGIHQSRDKYFASTGIVYFTPYAYPHNNGGFSIKTYP